MLYIAFGLLCCTTVLSVTMDLSTSRNIFHVLWNLNVHHCFHNNLPPIPIQNQINLVQVLISYVVKIFFFKLTFQHMHLSSMWPHSFRFPPSKPCMNFPSSLYMPHALPISFSSICLYNIR